LAKEAAADKADKPFLSCLVHLTLLHNPSVFYDDEFWFTPNKLDIPEWALQSGQSCFLTKGAFWVLLSEHSCGQKENVV